MIFSYYYCEYSINELRELYPVGRDGLNLFIIKNIAEDKGFDTKAFRVNSSYDILFPSIINIDRVHFVVAEKKTRKGIKIVDPQKGRYEISEEEILHKNMTIGLQIVGTEYSEKRKIVVSKKIFDDIKTNMPLIVKSVFVTVLLQTISLLVPICLSKFIDNLSALKVIFNWKILLPIFFVMTLLHITLSIIKEKLLVQLQVRINNEISETFVKKILTLPICQTADYLGRFPQIISDGNTCHSLRSMRQKHIISGVTADYRGLISVQLWLD